MRFACAEAARRGWAVQLVSTWHYPSDTRPTAADPAGLLMEGRPRPSSSTISEIGPDYPTVHASTPW